MARRAVTGNRLLRHGQEQAGCVRCLKGRRKDTGQSRAGPGKTRLVVIEDRPFLAMSQIGVHVPVDVGSVIALVAIGDQRT